MSLLCVRQGTRHFSHATLNPESNTTKLSYPNCAGKVTEDLRVSGTCLRSNQVDNSEFELVGSIHYTSAIRRMSGARMLVINGWNQSS